MNQEDSEEFDRLVAQFNERRRLKIWVEKDDIEHGGRYVTILEYAEINAVEPAVEISPELKPEQFLHCPCNVKFVDGKEGLYYFDYMNLKYTHEAKLAPWATDLYNQLTPLVDAWWEERKGNG